MKLQIDKRWKFVAKDSDGTWYAYDSPVVSKNHRWITKPGGGYTRIDAIFQNLPDCTPENSLHKILPDGTLRKALPDLKKDDPVICIDHSGEEHKRHFSHYTGNDEIACFPEGKTSFTTESGRMSYWSEWKLPEESKDE